MKLKIFINHIKNERVFQKNYLEKICESVNNRTNILNFYPVKITSTGIGLKNAIIRSKYKISGRNSSCKIIMFENSKGELRASVRKGLTLTFISDMNKFSDYIKKLNK